MFRYKWKKKTYYKKYFKKRHIKFRLKHIIYTYRDYRLRFYRQTAPLHEIYTTIFLIRQRKRQHHYIFIKLNEARGYTFSTGQIIAQYGNYGKFFKRSPSSLPGIALQIKKTKKMYLANIYLLSINNFSKKQYSLFEKLFSLTSYNILYFIHKKSYIGQPRKKHRIARSVLRLLAKQQY